MDVSCAGCEAVFAPGVTAQWAKSRHPACVWAKQERLSAMGLVGLRHKKGTRDLAAAGVPVSLLFCRSIICSMSKSAMQAGRLPGRSAHGKLHGDDDAVSINARQSPRVSEAASTGHGSLVCTSCVAVVHLQQHRQS